MEGDSTTLRRIETIHPKLRKDLHLIYENICMQLTAEATCRFTDVLRTFEEQEALYAKGRTKTGRIVTNAAPGQSFHNYGLAVDFCLIINGQTASWNMHEDFDSDYIPDWMEVVGVFKAYGWEWGGDWKSFKDFPHFQKRFGHSYEDLLAMHNSGNVDDDGYVIL